MPPALEEIGKVLMESFKPLEKTHFNNSEAGQVFGKILKDQYVPQVAIEHSNLLQQEAKLPFNQQRKPHLLVQEAKEKVRTRILGQNDWNGAALIKGVEKEAKTKGWNPMQIDAEKQHLANGVHMFLRDTQHTPIGDISVFKRNVLRNKEMGSPIDATAIYKPPTAAESAMKSYAAFTQLQGIVIPHIGTLFNYALNTPTRDLVHGMATMLTDAKTNKQFALDAGLFRGTLEDAYSVRLNGAKGAIARVTNQQFGAWVGQMIHSPGFNPLREITISLGAAAGKHHLERMAEDLVKSRGTDTFAAHQLMRFGVNPKAVLKNGLTNDMLKAGIFKYVDMNAVLDTSMDRSFNSNRNFFTRMGSTYHGYISRQGKLIRNSLVDSVQQSVGKDRSLKGAAMAAKTMGMLAIAFPNVGIGLKALEKYGRGQYQEASPVEDYENLWGKNGPTKAMLTALDGYAHLGAMGIVTGYVESSIKHQLADAIIGPIGNEISNLIQDTALGITKENFEPLARDVLEDAPAPWNLGKIAAHQFLPTTKEEKNRNPKLTRHIKRSKHF